MVPKLIYFDIPGKAEAIRLCAAVGHVEMEDVRVTREQFNTMQARLPVLKCTCNTTACRPPPCASPPTMA